MITVQDWEMANKLKNSSSIEEKREKKMQGIIFSLSCTVLHVAPQK